MKKIFTRLLVWALLLSTVACTVPLQIKDHARRTNQIVWQVHSEMILKNILRARDHQPMLFTSVDQVRGSLTYSAGTGTLPVPFGGATEDVYGINPTASISSNPSFDVSILLDDDFYRGILSPIPLNYVRLYVEQGWPMDELLLLAIESYPGCAEATPPCANNPEEKDAFIKFTRIIDRVTNACSVNVCLRFDTRTSTPVPILPAALSNFDIVAAMQAGYTVSPVGTTSYTVSRPGSLVLKGPCVDPDTGQPTAVFETLAGLWADPFDGNVMLHSANTECGKIVFRSPQGVIFYLGESLRDGAQPIVALSHGVPQIVVECGDQYKEEDFVVSVPHDGELCGIPADPRRAGDSLRTLSFVSQLLGLERSAKTLRTTGATQVIN